MTLFACLRYDSMPWQIEGFHENDAVDCGFSASGYCVRDYRSR
jgi:hypothetical protein